MSIHVGEVEIICPDCGEHVEVGCDASITTDDDGTQRLVFEGDMANIWLHSWTKHQRAAD